MTTKSINFTIAIIFLKAGLLLLFLLEISLLPFFSLGTGSADDLIVFNIEMNKSIILRKQWINCQ